jgi:hypothetical protein
MEKLILQSESSSERLRALKNSADKVEMFSTQGVKWREIQELQSNLSQDMIVVKKSKS